MGAQKVQWVHRGAEAPEGLLRQDADPQNILSPFSSRRNRTDEVQNSRPKGYDTLQPVSVKSLLAWEVKKGFPNTAVYKTVLVSYEVKEGESQSCSQFTCLC